ncbi:MAG: exosortase, partial [Nevskiaceae bacterium]|nr:exosortase [Nevskiaceae bacterium]
MKPAHEYAISRVQWAWLGVALAVLLVMFWSTFQVIWQHWHREEYSHGFLVPLISLLLIWQKRRQLQQLPFTGSWVGVALALGGVGLYFVSHYGGLALIDAYALVIVIAGLILAVMGWKAFAVILPAVALLFLMVPLPTFFFNKLSSFLQLISSQLGVAVIRAFDISVFLQGNVIDLGSYKLQVVEACSGLRYLFPLLTLGIIIACVVRLPLWIKTVVVLSTIPVTILMNSFRIGVIGLLVDRYGIAQAEGFLHDFEGWAIFMACFAVLMIEIWALVRFTGDKRSLRDILAIDWPAARPATARVDHRAMHAPLIAGVAAVTLGSLGALTLPYQQEIKPERTWFSAFPLELGAWRGHREALENDVLSTLMLDDYILADYVSAGEPPVNFYVAYYA